MPSSRQARAERLTSTWLAMSGIGPGYASVNASLVKNSTLSERVNLQLRAEAFNLFNRPNFNLPDNFLGSPTFGQITSARDPRHLQFGVKLLF